MSQYLRDSDLHQLVIGLGLFISVSSLPSLLTFASRSAKVTHQLQAKTTSSFSEETTTNNNKVSYWVSKDADSYFLREVLGEKALDWVKGQNDLCVDTLGDLKDTQLFKKILDILDSKERIPYVSKIGKLLYNFWQDEKNPKGIWRRTTLESYETSSPKWETVLDLDLLAKDEKEPWVWKGYTQLDVMGEKYSDRRVIVRLSRGGADATVSREFDLRHKTFVTELPFVLPEAKSAVSWKDLNTLLVCTDMKDGKSLTDSGYPRTVREWKRGTTLEESKLVYEGEASDVSVGGYLKRHGSHSYEMRYRSITFYTQQVSVLLPSLTDSSTRVWYVIPVPDDAEIDIFADQLLIQLRSPWVVKKGTAGASEEDKEEVTYAAGSLLALPLADFVQRRDTSEIVVLFEPTETVSLDSFCATKDHLIITSLDSVKTRLVFWKYTITEAAWNLIDCESNALIRGVSVSAYDRHESNAFWLTTNSFIQPTKLFMADAFLGSLSINYAKEYKSLARQFDFKQELVEEQYEALSKDGTKVSDDHHRLLEQRHRAMKMSSMTCWHADSIFLDSSQRYELRRPEPDFVVRIRWL